MNCVFRMTSFYCYEWSCKFIHYYKKKVRNENITFHNFCYENNWYEICKKKNQTSAVNIREYLALGYCLVETRQSLVTAINSYPQARYSGLYLQPVWNSYNVCSQCSMLTLLMLMLTSRHFLHMGQLASPGSRSRLHKASEVERMRSGVCGRLLRDITNCTLSWLD
jgi:hypothetical protein